HPRVVGTRVVHEVAAVVVPGPGCRIEVLPGRAHGAHPIDAKDALTPGPMAPRGDVPGAEGVEDPPRVDDPGRHLVSSERVVVELHLLVVRGGDLETREMVSGADVDGEAPRRPQRLVELRQRGRERSVAVGSGYREERPSGREQGETF